MKNSVCKIHYDTEHVEWTIPKKTIEKTLMGNIKERKNNFKKGNSIGNSIGNSKGNAKNKIDGLLYLSVESAGTIEFQDTSCKINSNNEKVCNKLNTIGLKYKNGNKDSVMTPLAVVNFHTHPLSCYIDAQTVWGWPSGEDLAQCINFANSNNLTHLIFAIEGTYIMDFNKELLNYLKTNKKLLNIIIKNVEEIFKMTHKHRMIINDSNPNITLEYEFYHIFLKPIGLPEKENILISWLNLVNNLTLNNLIILSNEFSKYFKEIKKIPMKDIEPKYLSMKLFNIQFIKHKTIQWSNLTKQEIFNRFINEKYTLDIQLPNEIKYTAPFISQQCKL